MYTFNSCTHTHHQVSNQYYPTPRDGNRVDMKRGLPSPLRFEADLVVGLTDSGMHCFLLATKLLY